MKNLIKPEEAASILGVSARQLQLWRSGGGGPVYHKLGRRLVRYDPDDLSAWQQRQRDDALLIDNDIAELRRRRVDSLPFLPILNGIYVLFISEDVQYVGQSVNIQGRVNSHARKGVLFDAISVVETAGADESQRRMIEAAYLSPTSEMSPWRSGEFD